MAPIVACTTLGLKQSAVVSEQTMSWMPNQSQRRMIVPRLPGSWMQSRAKVSASADGTKGVGWGI